MNLVRARSAVTTTALILAQCDFLNLTARHQVSQADTTEKRVNLLAEVRDKLDKDVISVQAVRCTLFEDNSGALELARTPKMRPRTKHINIKYHHFRDHVRRKLISIEHVATEDQVADIFTKPLPVVAFLRHRKSLQRW